jgi:hypothetical protein
MDSFEPVVDGVLNTEVDLLALSATDMVADQNARMKDILMMEAKGIELEDGYFETEADRANREIVEAPRKREMATRRRIIDLFVEETGGKAALKNINFNRSWDERSDGIFLTSMQIIQTAYSNWLNEPANRDVLLAVAPDVFETQDNGDSSLAEIHIITEVMKRLGMETGRDQ